MITDFNEPNLCHVYGQPQWHDPVVIVANREALERLRDGINQLLETKQVVKRIEMTTNDGEGFNFYLCKEESAFYSTEASGYGSALWNNLTVPYYDAIAQPRSGISPWDAFRKYMVG